MSDRKAKGAGGRPRIDPGGAAKDAVMTIRLSREERESLDLRRRVPE